MARFVRSLAQRAIGQTKNASMEYKVTVGEGPPFVRDRGAWVHGALLFLLAVPNPANLPIQSPLPNAPIRLSTLFFFSPSSLRAPPLLRLSLVSIPSFCNPSHHNLLHSLPPNRSLSSQSSSPLTLRNLITRRSLLSHASCMRPVCLSSLFSVFQHA